MMLPGENGDGRATELPSYRYRRHEAAMAWLHLGCGLGSGQDKGVG
jgi:hypothetical protein